MADRTINFGESETEATYQIQDTDSTGGGNFVLARDTNANTVLLQYDPAADTWEYAGDVDMNGGNVSGVGTLTADSVNTDLTETTPTSGVFHQNNRLIQAYFDSSSLGSWGTSEQLRLRFTFGTSVSTNRNFMIGIRLVKGEAFADRDAYVYKDWIGNLAGNAIGNVQSDIRFETRGASASVSDTGNDHEIDLVVTDSDSTQPADKWTALVTAFAAPSSITISQSVIESV